MSDKESPDRYQSADALARVVEQAIRLQRSAEVAVVRSERMAEQLGYAADRIPTVVSEEVARSLSSAADKAAERMSANLKEVHEAATRATATFRAIERRVSWKIYGSALGAFAFVCVTTVAAVRYMTPNIDDIRQLRAERESLMADINRLEAAGARAQMSSCRDNRGRTHVCVRTDEAKGRYGDDYRILYGH